MPIIRRQFFNGNTYSASDFVESNKNVMRDGVLANLNYLKVVIVENMNIAVTSGRGWIQGHAFQLENNLSFTVPQADGSLDRVDTIVIRLDTTAGEEKIECLLVCGTPSLPFPEPIRNGVIYDLVIAKINVPAATTSITFDLIIDTRNNINLCGFSGALNSDQLTLDEKVNLSDFNDLYDFIGDKVDLPDLENGSIQTSAEKLQNKPISTANPLPNQSLKFVNNQWTPQFSSFVYASGQVRPMASMGSTDVTYVYFGAAYANRKAIGTALLYVGEHDFQLHTGFYTTDSQGRIPTPQNPNGTHIYTRSLPFVAYIID